MNFLDAHAGLLSTDKIPADYVLWSAAWCVGTGVGRSIHVDLPTPVFLNPSVIMVSNKGLAKERTVEDICTRIVRESMSSNVVFEQGPMMTKLRQQQDLFGHGHAAFVGLDFGRSLFGKGQDVHSVLARSPSVLDRISNPYVSVLSHVAQDFIAGKRGSLAEKAYTADCIFASRRKGEGLRSHAATLGSVTENLKRIIHDAKAMGVIHVTDDAKEFLANFNGSRKADNNLYARNFRTQFDAHVFRLAAIFELAEHSDTITRKTVQESLIHVLRAERFGSYLFAEAASSRNTIGMERLRATLLDAKPSISHTALYHHVRTWFKAFEYRGTLAILRDAGLVLSWRTKASNGNGGYHYSATDRLRNPQLWNEVLVKAGYDPDMEDEE